MLQLCWKLQRTTYSNIAVECRGEVNKDCGDHSQHGLTLCWHMAAVSKQLWLEEYFWYGFVLPDFGKLTSCYIQWASLMAQMVKNLLQCRRPGFDHLVGKIPWRRKWQLTPVFLPGESHGQRSLVGYSPCGCKELDTTERHHFLSLLSLLNNQTSALMFCWLFFYYYL